MMLLDVLKHTNNIRFTPTDITEHIVPLPGRCVIEKQKALNTILDGDNRILFDELEDAFGRINEQSAMDSFVEGFRLGANLMLETF